MFVEECASENADNWSSMHQDLHHGRRTEVQQLETDHKGIVASPPPPHIFA